MKAKIDKSTGPEEQDKESRVTVKKDFPIVGIGASAGGIEALESFFQNMPVNSGMAFVVIQHLDPTHVGMMPELLQKYTPMKVNQAEDMQEIKPNRVYVIPPNKSMSILKGVLHLFDPVEIRGLRLPVDLFFRSLANDLQEKSIGIILSGMGSDGSLGVKAIKEKDGIVLIQQPSEAKFDSMPRSASEAVIADILAPAAELPSKLLDILKFIPPVKIGKELEFEHKSNLDKIIILIREHSGIDFTSYKKNTLIRRIERRKGVHQIDKISNYVRYLQENPAELEILIKELLIGVSNFFRDPAVWDLLSEKILPQFISEFPEKYELRAWVPACSTGEEAYSLAMVFTEALERVDSAHRVSLQIFATDLNAEAIEIARKGYFPKNIEADVSLERLKRFFIAENDHYRINSAVREMVVFAPQNIIKDPPFTKIDILSCRNMLIYMEQELQKKIVSLFNYSMNPGGLLILGLAETPGITNDGFREIDSKYKIYKRQRIFEKTDLLNLPESNFRIEKKQISDKKPVENIQYYTEQYLLQKFAPPSVLVNNQGDILYITGHTGKYLEPAAGKANWNIFAMAREKFRYELPLAFRKAAKTYEPVILKQIKLDSNGTTQYVDVTLQCISQPEILRDMIIIVFNEVKNVIESEGLALKAPKGKSSHLVNELKAELQRSYEELNNTREEMQTTQEELKSINEELQSANEELQSTNEELTTSKEEMQSMNEELQTVNTELQSKVNDLTRSNDDMKNLLNSTEIATLFLDKSLNVRRFTDEVTKIFKLRLSDIGRPITDLVTDLQYKDLGNDAIQVVKKLIPKEIAISTNDGRWFSIRIMPYRTLDDRIDGVVITFLNITKAKTLELELKSANDTLKKLSRQK
jgi:two-component system CheB/CheR fusion protein